MMTDERIRRLAENVLKYSVGLKKGERIYIEAFGNSTQDFFRELIAVSSKIGATPFYYFNDESFTRSFLLNASEAAIKAHGEIHRRKRWRFIAKIICSRCIRKCACRRPAGV